MNAKINAKNASEILAALKKVNGAARNHTFTTYDEIGFVADEAEKALADIGLPICHRAGAMYVKTSGGKVANAYKNMRKATTVTLLRKSGGWYLADVKSADIYTDGGGKGQLSLTIAQHSKVVLIMLKKYTLIEPK